MKRISQRFALAAGSALGLSFAIVAPAWAQPGGTPPTGQAATPANPNASSNDEEIVVTARRREERLQDVPISITLFNQQQLTNNNVVNAQDLATYTPSLSANTLFGSDNTTFAIRGFVQEIGTAPSVGVYFADVVTPRGASNGISSGDGLAPGTLFDLENVQVLKGPQGTLFGRNTTGGAVLVVPHKPTNKLEGYVEGSVGNHNMWRLQAVLNLPVSDAIRVRLGVDRMKREGYLHNQSGIGPKHFADLDYIGARASVVVDVTSNLENYTIFQYNHSSNRGPLQKLVALDPAQSLGFLFSNAVFPLFFADQPSRQGSGFYNVMQNTPHPSSKLNQWQVINTTTWKASDTLTVKNIASYAELKQSIFAELFGFDGIINLTPFGLSSYHFGFANINHPPGVPTAHESTLTEELQVQGRTADDRLTWQAGAYYERAHPLGLSGSQSPGFSSCIDPFTFQCTDPLGLFFGGIQFGSINYTVGKTSFRDVGLYTQGTYKFSDHLRTTAGFRYTWDRSTNVSDQRVFTLLFPPLYGVNPVTPFRCSHPEAIPTGCISTYHQQSSAPTWTIDLEYTPNKDLMAYAKYSRGYRAGTIAPNITAPLNLIDPEKVDTFEVGVKGSFGGAVRGTFNAAAFYNDFTNQQIQIGFIAKPFTGQSSTAAPINLPKSSVWGFEFDGTIRPFTGLELAAGYTYLRTKIKKIPDFSGINDPNFDLQAFFHVGDPNPFSPRHKLTLSATYTLPLDESIGKVSLGAVFTYRSRMLVNYTDRFNTNPALAQFSVLPSLSLLNLNFNWEGILGSPVDLGLFATNVTNKKYYLFAGGLASLGLETAVVGEPRMFGARARVRFGAAAH
jgi:iron complex outermembrane receptor protein